MKSASEIAWKLAELKWNVDRLSKATGESEFNVRYALQNPEETDTRQKISKVTGISYQELFGEEI